MSTASVRGEARAAARRLAGVLLLAGLALPALAGPAGTTDRASVEGAFLVNFVRFTQWPASRFARADTPYTVAVVGSERVADAVRAVTSAAGEIHGRRIVVRHVPGRHVDDRRADLRSSHLVFLHRSAGVPAADVLQAVDGASVLTVGDSAGFVEAGGMLGLVVDGRRLAFVANPDAVRHGGVDVSAKVLKLARTMRP